MSDKNWLVDVCTPDFEQRLRIYNMVAYNPSYIPYTRVRSVNDRDGFGHALLYIEFVMPVYKHQIKSLFGPRCDAQPWSGSRVDAAKWLVSVEDGTFVMRDIASSDV